MTSETQREHERFQLGSTSRAGTHALFITQTQMHTLQRTNSPTHMPAQPHAARPHTWVYTEELTPALPLQEWHFKASG